MLGWFRNLSAITVAAVLGTGCMNGAVPPGGGDSTGVSDVATKALDVATEVGGANGFGGSLMDGYADHMPDQMGFSSEADLASGTSSVTIRIRNESDLDGTFHLSHFAGHMDPDEQMTDVEVAAGDEVTIEIPCSEIVGMGPLNIPGEAGCHLSNNEPVDNTMAVPGFLGQDFTCDGVYEFVLTPDLDDLDADGDTEELIIVSDALLFHMLNGGPMGHMYGGGAGMMGSHMGG